MRNENAKKSKIKIIILAALCFLGLQVIFLFGYKILDGYVDKTEMKAVCQEIESILDNDSTFEDKYGELSSLSLNEDNDIVDIEEDVTRIPRDAIFENGKNILIFVDFEWSTGEVIKYTTEN